MKRAAKHVFELMPSRAFWRAVAAAMLLATTPLLGGCQIAVLDPDGPIGYDERSIIVLSTGLMLIVVIPVIVMTLAFAWRYRELNTKATFAPDWSHSNKIEAVVWLVPCLIVAVLATVTWVSTHKLDPYRRLSLAAKTINVDVVSLDWKWLFIYPDLKIASVDELAFPAGTPVRFHLTSATVMNSFFIPRLGSQMDTMPGMETKLSLVAREPGDFAGISANYSGDGFSGMDFTARAMTVGDFQNWVKKVRTSPQVLTKAAYQQLEQPSEDVPVIYYGDVEPSVYHDALNKCANGATCTDDAMRFAMAKDTFGKVGLCETSELGNPAMTMMGKLTMEAIPYHQPIIMGAVGFMAVGGVTLVALLTYFRLWKWLWSEWLTSVDHKKIGIMYIVLALVMLLRGFSDAIMMRTQQALASTGGAGYLPPEHFDQVFTAHGVIMIFFMAMPFIVGLMNIVMPLQIGARDVAFPYLNNLSFWLTAAGALLVNFSLALGEFARTGWLAYPPLSELAYSPGVGVDYYLWSLQIAGIGTLLSGVNMITTILTLRAPGMTMMRMPVFCWTTLCANMLIVAAFPILTATLAMLALDRYLGMHFFTNDAGGDAMMYVNLIWAWGHPEVYILILPCFGIFSEVISTFSGKPLFGYTSMVYATICITILSFVVWLHHFFTMGSGADVNAFFGITTMIISIPTGVKIFNWLFTMYRGRVRFTTPVLWTIGFMITFTIGGMTGVLMAVPPADFVLHNSLFLIAHFHNAIIGGVVFGCMAGFTYWFPKAFGFKLDERLGKVSFWCWLIGFYLAFMPLYILGLMGMTRRLDHFNNPVWHVYLVVAMIGAAIIMCGIVAQLAQIALSILNREALRDVTGDPWNGRTLEWSTASPPPFYNFAQIPLITGRDAYWDLKQKGMAARSFTTYQRIHMPRNTGAGIIISAFAAALGFGLIWHIWWLAIIAFAGAIGVAITHSFDEDRDYYVSPDEVAQIEGRHLPTIASQA